MIYAVGLGVPQSTIQAGQPAISPIPTSVSVSFDWLANALGSRPISASLTQPTFAGLVTGYVGLYQINVVVPALPTGTQTCNGNPVGVSSNLTINIVGHTSFDGARICATPWTGTKFHGVRASEKSKDDLVLRLHFRIP